MTPLEFLYFLGYSVKRHYALKNQKRLPNKVISIGNITLGGTGKTPAAMALARKAAAMGFYPCILTRGYKGKAEGSCFVSKGDGPLIDAYQAGDEAMLMAETLRGVAVVKGKNRYAAGTFAIANLKSDISNLESKLLFILDDGFQHWVLHRDKDILLIDGTSPYGNRKLFPSGPLREPLSAMKRADIIVITNSYSRYPNSAGDVCVGDEAKNKGSNVESLAEEVKRYAVSAPLFFAQHRPSSLIASSGNVFALSDMKNKKVFAFCGIGNPHSFKNTLLRLAGTLTGFMIFRDHYQYSRADFRMIADNARRSGADWIVTTEKDIMRLRGFSMPDNLLALRIEFHVDDKFYAEVFDWRR